CPTTHFVCLAQLTLPTRRSSDLVEMIEALAPLPLERKRGSHHQVALDLQLRILLSLGQAQHLLTDGGRPVDLAAIEVETRKAAQDRKSTRLNPVTWPSRMPSPA